MITVNEIHYSNENNGMQLYLGGRAEWLNGKVKKTPYESKLERAAGIEPA